MSFFTLRPTCRPSSVDSPPEARSYGVPRAVGWSLSLAFAALLLVAPTTANAADPDEGTPLLGGTTGGVGGVADPVTETVAPVTGIVDPVTDPAVEPVEPVVEPVAQPLIQPVTNVIEPAMTAVEPVTGLVEPIVEPVTGILDPVTEAVDPVVAPVDGITSEPSTSEPSGDGGSSRVEPWVPGPPASTPIPYTPPADAMPAMTPGVHSVNPDVPSPVFQLAPTSDRQASGFEDPGPWVRAPQAMDAGPSANASTASSLSPPWWTRIGPIGALGGLGSGQAWSGVSIAVAMGLGLLLLFLLPPPLRVSRLQPAAVFWRPQAFVGPLERPG